MSHNRAAAILAVVLLAGLFACKQKQEPGPAPAEKVAAAGDPSPAEPSGSSAAGAAPAAKAPAAAPAAQAPAAEAPAAPGAAGAADAGPPSIDPATLAGHYGFDWFHPESARCKKVDGKLIAALARGGSGCERQSGEVAFADGAGDYARCRAGKAEWLIYSTKAICQEQIETMQANGP